MALSFAVGSERADSGAHGVAVTASLSQQVRNFDSKIPLVMGAAPNTPPVRKFTPISVC